MRAYKFLRPGAVGPFSGHRWPVPAGGDPGAWVEAAGGPALCRGVHGCRVADLPWWVQEELWEAEFDAPDEVAAMVDGFYKQTLESLKRRVENGETPATL